MLDTNQEFVVLTACLPSHMQLYWESAVVHSQQQQDTSCRQRFSLFSMVGLRDWAWYIYRSTADALQ